MQKLAPKNHHNSHYYPPVETISNYLFLWVCFVTYQFSSLLHPVKTLKNSLKENQEEHTGGVGRIWGPLFFCFA